MSRIVYKNFVFLFIVQFSNYVLPFLVIPVLTRALGVEGFGKYAYYIALPNLLMIIVRFGFEFSATRQVSIESGRIEKIIRIVSAVYILRISLLLLASLVLAAIVFTIKPDEQDITLVIGGFLLLLGQALLPIWYFQGIQKMQFVTFYTVITKIIYVALLILLVSNTQDYGLAVLIYGGAFALAGIVSSLHVAFNLNFKFIWSKKDIAEQFKLAVPFFASRACVTSYTASIVPILGFVGTPAQVAIYAASEKLYLAAQSVMYPLANALYPHVAKHKDISLFKKLFVGTLVILSLGGAIGYFVAPHLIVFLFGSEFAESAQIFNYHLIALIFVFPSIMLGYPLLAALGFSKEANSSVVYGALFFLIVASVGILLDIAGAKYLVIAVICVEAIVFILRAYFAITRVFGSNNKQEEVK